MVDTVIPSHRLPTNHVKLQQQIKPYEHIQSSLLFRFISKEESTLFHQAVLRDVINRMCPV